MSFYNILCNILSKGNSSILKNKIMVYCTEEIEKQKSGYNNV